MRKIYGCDTISLNMAVLVDNKVERVEFKGGSYGGGMSISATYSTNNVALMDAIEKSERFVKGRVFVLKSITEPGDELKKEQVSPKGDVVPPNGLPETGGEQITPDDKEETGKDQDDGDDSKDDVEAISYPDVTNFQQAKNVLKTKHDVVLINSVTKEEVIAKASELKVLFPNWN